MIFNLIILIYGVFIFIIGLLPFISHIEVVRNKIKSMSDLRFRLWGLIISFSGIILIYLLSRYLETCEIIKILREISPKLQK
jgi:uncharacterized protein YjeT (DUF2065 family)